MCTHDIIKLISAVNGTVCIVFGIIALFRGIKADGVVEIGALIKGKIKTGSAGILLLFFGIVLIGMPVLKGKEEIKPLDIRTKEIKKIEEYIEGSGTRTIKIEFL